MVLLGWGWGPDEKKEVKISKETISKSNEAVLDKWRKEINTQKEFLKSRPNILKFHDVDTDLVLSIMIAEHTGTGEKEPDPVGHFCRDTRRGGMNVYRNKKGEGGWGAAQVDSGAYHSLVRKREYRKFFTVKGRVVPFRGKGVNTIAGYYGWNIRAMLALMNDNHKWQYERKQKVRKGLPESQEKLYLAALHNMGAGRKGVVRYVLNNPTGWEENIPKVHREFLGKVKRIYGKLAGKELVPQEKLAALR